MIHFRDSDWHQLMHGIGQVGERVRAIGQRGGIPHGRGGIEQFFDRLGGHGGVVRGSKEDMWRSGLKYGLPTVAAGLGVDYAANALRNAGANSQYQKFLEQYAEPAGQ
jgi:hypothetical protein